MGGSPRPAFADIWNGEDWQNLRRWHGLPDRQDIPTYHACYRCYQHRNVDFEDVFGQRLARCGLNVTIVQSDR